MKRKIKRTVIAVLLTLVTCSSVFAIDDTIQNRTVQANRYLAVAPPKDILKESAEKVALTLHPDQQAGFKDLLIKHLNLEKLIVAVTEALVKNFSADELSALADFYGSAVGKSAMKKFGAYMADIMPVLQSELENAATKAAEEMNPQRK